MTEPTSYPHHLVGAPAPPPEQVERRVLGMAIKAHTRHLAAVDHELRTAARWRLARSLEQLVAEANASDPARATASDGGIGDARHQLENGPNGPGSGSDHNPWVILGGEGIVRAYDITNDPALDLPTVAERIRAGAAAGRLPQVLGGGYVILNGRITAADWSGWRVYRGADPHVSHMHTSVGLTATAFDDPRAWGVFTSEQPAPTPPTPPAPPRWTGPDLTGSGSSLRGDQSNNGPRVQAWQRWLAANYPAYRHEHGALADDGWWGPITSAWNAEFGHRSGIPSADGRNIGPKLATAYARAGLFGARAAAAPPQEDLRPEPMPATPATAKSSARERVLGHLARRGSR